MKNNNYQIAGIKGRLSRPGFIACYLLIVLLYACNGGYVPSVGGENTITYEYNKDKELEVTVHIPGKITDEIQHGAREEDYKVQFIPEPTEASWYATMTPTVQSESDGSYNINRTTIFTINVTNLTAITVGIGRNLYITGKAPETVPVAGEKITISAEN